MTVILSGHFVKKRAHTLRISYLGIIELDPAHEPVEDLDVAVDGNVHVIQLLVRGHLPEQISYISITVIQRLIIIGYTVHAVSL
jgi:hypothetical protein